MVLLLVGAVLLSGCDQLGIDTPAKQAQRREAEGKAIGAACRHTQRSLEDCYASNPKASKAAIFAGWREMDEYMRENDIPPAAPARTTPPAPPAPPEEIVESSAPAQSAAPATSASGAATATSNAARPSGAAGPGAVPGAAATAGTASPPATARGTPPTGSIVPPLGPGTAPANQR